MLILTSLDILWKNIHWHCYNVQRANLTINFLFNLVVGKKHLVPGLGSLSQALGIPHLTHPTPKKSPSDPSGASFMVRLEMNGEMVTAIQT